MSNKANQFFYDEVTPKMFYQNLQQLGLSSNPDLTALAKNIQLEAFEMILDVGSGLGRVVPFLLKNCPHAKLFLVERNTGFFKHLEKDFGHIPNITLVRGDINDVIDEIPKVNLILLLWTVFTEFNRSEQADLLAKLYNKLEKDGLIVIDNLELPESGGMIISDEFNNVRIEFHVPELRFFEDMKVGQRFSELTVIPYKSSTNKDRYLASLKK